MKATYHGYINIEQNKRHSLPKIEGREITFFCLSSSSFFPSYVPFAGAYNESDGRGLYCIYFILIIGNK